MNDAVAVISALPRDAARMLAVEILLADPEALGDDVLESCLYILREKLRTPEPPGGLALPGHRAPAVLQRLNGQGLGSRPFRKMVDRWEYRGTPNDPP